MCFMIRKVHKVMLLHGSLLNTIYAFFMNLIFHLILCFMHLEFKKSCSKKLLSLAFHILVQEENRHSLDFNSLFESGKPLLFS